MENENELGEDRSKEGGERERTLLCGSWGQEVGIGGGSEVFGGDKWGWKDGGRDQRHCPGQIFGRKFCLPEGLLVYVPESCLIECCHHHPPKVVPDQLLGKEV